jgi:hypothetical protein
MEKDPRDRTQSAAELRANLRRCKRELESGETAAGEPIERTERAASWSRVDSPIGWSPDGRRFAFVRAGFDGSSALLVADAEGANERTVATRKLPAQFLSFGSRGAPSAQGAGIHPAWSPDGTIPSCPTSGCNRSTAVRRPN